MINNVVSQKSVTNDQSCDINNRPGTGTVDSQSELNSSIHVIDRSLTDMLLSAAATPPPSQTCSDHTDRVDDDVVISLRSQLADTEMRLDNESRNSFSLKTQIELLETETDNYKKLQTSQKA